MNIIALFLPTGPSKFPSPAGEGNSEYRVVKNYMWNKEKSSEKGNWRFVPFPLNTLSITPITILLAPVSCAPVGEVGLVE
ncbi:MAG TPA: hypothetical protein VFD91_12670 [Mariniphaga sp.]|nr:hypothetical protein [Mariniphaga sp.]